MGGSRAERLFSPKNVKKSANPTAVGFEQSSRDDSAHLVLPAGTQTGSGGMGGSVWVFPLLFVVGAPAMVAETEAG